MSADPPVGHPRLVKLVRDRVADFLPDSSVAFRPIEDREAAIEALRKKLAEEVAEYLLQPCVGELADVLEAVKALAVHDLRVPFAAVEREADAKLRERGGFAGLMGMWCWSTAPARHEGAHAMPPPFETEDIERGI